MGTYLIFFLNRLYHYIQSRKVETNTYNFQYFFNHIKGCDIIIDHQILFYLETLQLIKN